MMTSAPARARVCLTRFGSRSPAADLARALRIAPAAYMLRGGEASRADLCVMRLDSVSDAPRCWRWEEGEGCWTATAIVGTRLAFGSELSRSGAAGTLRARAGPGAVGGMTVVRAPVRTHVRVIDVLDGVCAGYAARSASCLADRAAPASSGCLTGGGEPAGPPVRLGSPPGGRARVHAQPLAGSRTDSCGSPRVPRRS
jgi:hypothetical protein